MRFSAIGCVYCIIFNLFINIYKGGGANVFCGKRKRAVKCWWWQQIITLSQTGEIMTMVIV